MREGRSLQGLVTEIERQYAEAEDFFVPSSKLRVTVAEEKPRFEFIVPPDREKGIPARTVDLGILPVAHEQLAQRTGIPKPYYDKMRDEALIDGGDRSKWGLANAITRFSQEEAAGTYDDATDLERLGGEIITLAPTDWKRISKEAAALAA